MEGAGRVSACKLGSRTCKKCILIGASVIVIAGNVAIYLHTLPCAWAQEVANVLLIPYMMMEGGGIVWEAVIEAAMDCKMPRI